MIPNKVVALFASAFAFGSAWTLADDKTFAQPVDQAKQYNDPYGRTPVRTSRGTPLIGDFQTPRDGALTPKEKAAAKKAARAKKQQDAAAAKAQPKALPSGRPQIGVPVDRRYREPLPPGR